MREIKFRGKRPNSGKWITGGLVQKGIFSYILGNGHFEVECSTEVIRETVGQFTGLKDKNGVEIYEGDIYNLGDHNITYTVIWKGSGLIGKQNGSSSYAGLEYWKDQIEIIGNIHDKA